MAIPYPHTISYHTSVSSWVIIFMIDLASGEPSRAYQSVRITNLSGVDAAGHGSMDVPESALLTVEDLPLQSVPLLVHPARSGIMAL